MPNYCLLVLAIDLAYFTAIGVPLILISGVLRALEVAYAHEIGLALVIVALFILPWRAKLAADVMYAQDVGFIRAHRISAAAVRVMMSFLPVIGPLFEKKQPSDSP